MSWSVEEEEEEVALETSWRSNSTAGFGRRRKKEGDADFAI